MVQFIIKKLPISHHAGLVCFGLVFLMKLKFLKRISLMILMAGFVLTSCSDDSDSIVDQGTGQGKYEEGYLSMAFMNTTINYKSRAAATEDGTTNENKINNVLVVLYDASGDVAYQYELSAIGIPTYSTEAIKVDKQAYKLAVFLNYSADIKAATSLGKTTADIQSAVQMVVTDFTGTGTDPSNFLMSNFTGLTDVPITYIKDSKSQAEANPVHIYVERAVAKVIVNLAPDFESQSPTVVMADKILWQADVLNKHSYWMRKQTMMLADYSNTDKQIHETAFTNLNPTVRDLMYAEDPNFRNTSWAYWNYEKNILGNSIDWSSVTPPPTTNNQATYMDSRYQYITLSDVNIETKTSGGAWVYVPENTMVAEEQWEDATTSVVVKAVLNPGKTALSGTILNAGDSYFVYRSKVFSANELAKIDGDDINIDGNGNDWNDILDLNPELVGFQEFLQRKDVKKAILGSETALYSVLTSASPSVKYEALSYYKGGLNVYNVPIRHYSDVLQSKSMAYGRYGVVRNSVYKLTLKYIKNFGDIDIPKKENPNDKLSWLSVEFEILPWVVREQGTDLKGM